VAAVVLAGTFRDPAGSLFDIDGRILRLVRPAEVGTFETLLGHEVLDRLVARGAVVGTRRLEETELPDRLRGLTGAWFTHERVPFVSVPAEWSAAMLADAALHTLDINLELVRHGFILKDATPANVLFRGTEPVLVDVPSIEPLVAGRDIWIARHQFETTFLLPLMASLETGLPIKWSLADPARGLGHEEFARVLGTGRWWGADRIRHVALPAALAASSVSHRERPAVPAAAASDAAMRRTKYVLERSIGTLRKAVARLAQRVETRQSNWSAYEGTRSHYTEQDLDQKRAFVSLALESIAPEWALDVGANTGEFSEMAAKHASVIAVDVDEVSVSRIYRRARDSKRPIQPLVVDVTQPTPAAGWKNGERKSFLERARGRFDAVLMLAVGHHMRVTAGIPLAEIVDFGMSYGQEGLVFEFVPVSDPMFGTIARGREPIYTDNTLENCRSLLGQRGRIIRQQTLANGRTLFLVTGAE